MNGFLPVPRQAFFSQLWAEKKTFDFCDAYLDLQQIAAFVPTSRIIKGKLISLNVGEFVASERFLENRWSWSRTKVRSFTKSLELNQELDHRKDQGQTVRILSKYWGFSDWETKKEPLKKPLTRPEENQTRTKVEEGKKVRTNINNRKAPSVQEIEKQALSFIATLPPQTTEGLPDQFAKLEAISFNALWESREHPWRTQTGQDLLSGKKWISRLTKDLTDKIQEELKKAKRYGHQANAQSHSRQTHRPSQSSSRGDGNGLTQNNDEINPF